MHTKSQRNIISINKHYNIGKNQIAIGFHFHFHFHIFFLFN